ncbi:HipA family kinase [Armatimonas sp.]|uniref:HipA family kinase n=1 Tax=Armatimonas sp. TaxID=1872638 RepID=UPI00375187BB
MPDPLIDLWNPGEFVRFGRTIATSTSVAEVVMEEGTAYLKALGNPEGPHALAREFVGTCLARAFELPTLNYGLAQMDATVDEIPFGDGTLAKSGTAWVTESEPGQVWGGTAAELELLDNSQDIPRLVLFDTWIRNRDRHAPPELSRKPNYGNVFFSARDCEPDQYRLLAMDHTHVFTEGSSLTRRISNIGEVRDTKIYGRFPQFAPYLDAGALERAATDLQSLDPNLIARVVAAIPADWEVEADVREALREFLVRRAAFVTENWKSLL